MTRLSFLLEEVYWSIYYLLLELAATPSRIDADLTVNHGKRSKPPLFSLFYRDARIRQAGVLCGCEAFASWLEIVFVITDHSIESEHLPSGFW
jgi:hypothetical protein